MDTSVLNVVIGLVLIYLLYSLLATAIQEALSSIFQRRASTLFSGIKSMLSYSPLNESFVFQMGFYIVMFWSSIYFWFKSFSGSKRYPSLYRQFFQHPLINKYSENIIFNKPSYLTANSFSTILIDTIKNLDKTKEYDLASFELIKNNVLAYSVVTKIGNAQKQCFIDSQTFKILNFHLNEAAGDLDVFKYRIERWFNDTMDRVSGWYKRSTQLWLFVLGIILSIVFNVDTIEITDYLSINKEAAEKLADVGVALASNSKDSNSNKQLQAITDSLKNNINKVNTIIGLGYGDYGQSNAEFINLVLQNSKFNDEYNKDFATATKMYDSTLRAKDSLLKIISDSSAKNVIQKHISNLENNKDDIIYQIQLSEFYETEGSALKAKYIGYTLRNHPKKWIGFFLTAIALSLGAPFWFDLLNKFISLRTAVKTVDSSGSTTKNNSADNNDIDG